MNCQKVTKRTDVSVVVFLFSFFIHLGFFFIFIMRYKQILVTLLVIFQHVICYFLETLLHLLVLKVVVL